jgi:triphosphoribosyl-dephospho-CoA synthase
VFAGLLRKIPDSHIERKYGTRFSGMVADRMAIIEEALSDSDDPAEVLGLLRNVDREFKSLGINPGTTADLTVACSLAVRLEILGTQ